MTTERKIVTDQELMDMYRAALDRVIQRGWKQEVNRFRNLSFENVDGRFFFKEYARCVYASGFGWAKVSKHWDALTDAYKDWDYAEVSKNKKEVREQAMKFIGNKKKADAILSTAQALASEEWSKFKEWLRSIGLLLPPGELKFIGKVTRYHLARNIGADVAKPDRHMKRIAQKCGYPETPEGIQDFAKRVSMLTGERVGVVDVVLWRDSEGSKNQCL
jgi:hypothetical protein